MAAPSTPVRQVRLADVLGSLSYALDLTEGQAPGHALRCAWIGVHVGRALGLSEAELGDLFYASLLKDAGCSSNAARLWQLYGGDERLVKQHWKTVDSHSLVQVARYVLEHAGAGAALRERAQRVLMLVRHGGDLATELIQTRCERGANIVRKLGFSSRVAQGIYALDEHWNGKGKPDGLKGEAIPLFARIALLAQVVDVFHTVSGADAARTEASRRRGTWFDPRVVDALQTAAADPGFWDGLAAAGLEDRVLQLEPAGQAILVDEDGLDTIAEAFAGIVDAKSAFTSGHSSRVMDYADGIAVHLQVPPDRRRWLRRAALLHDIGKLGVSNGVLDKPGRLDEQEWQEMRRHPALSEAVLARSGVFGDLAFVAGAHHERLDGKGYPNGLGGEQIPLEARIITTADIFDALTADRPYRAAMKVEDALALMEKDRDTAIDGRCLDALRSMLATRTEPAMPAAP